MEDNAALLIYIYGLYDSLGVLSEAIVVIIGVAFFFSWIYPLVEDMNKQQIKNYYVTYFKLPAIVLVSLVLLNTFLPSKNILILMLSADPIVTTVKNASETKSIINILDNSLKYLEQQSEQLTKDK